MQIGRQSDFPLLVKRRNFRVMKNPRRDARLVSLRRHEHTFAVREFGVVCLAKINFAEQVSLCSFSFFVEKI